MMFKSVILVSLLTLSAMAERPHRGPKVGGQHARQQFGTYVKRPLTSDKQAVAQQNVYQPQPIQYVQQPAVAGEQQQPYQPVQYVPVNQAQFQQQQPIHYVPQTQFQQKQTIQYQPQQPTQYVQQQVQYKPTAKPVVELVDKRDMQPAKYHDEEDDIIASISRNAPAGARLIKVRNAGKEILKDRLISNYTTIRDEKLIVDTFSCLDRSYGYYADVDNDCQIFHICYPVYDIPYPELKLGEQPPPKTTYHFSFICPKWTIFAQDVMTCAWATEAIPCESSSLVAGVVNDRFFKKVKKETKL